MKEVIQLSIQEIVQDFYNLAQEEGYISGLTTKGDYPANEIEKYRDFMIEMGKKYIPNILEKHVSKKFWKKEMDEQGLEISGILIDNFKEIFYKLV